MLHKDYCPSEVIVELAKCLLGLLHFRVLSWAQFKILLRRRHVLASDLHKYDPALVDSDALNQLTDFKLKFNLDLNASTLCKFTPFVM
jgi:hypothetical protein